MATITGLAFGRPRRGKPKTNEERRRTHKAVYGNENIPKKRGKKATDWVAIEAKYKVAKKRKPKSKLEKILRS